MLHLFIMDGYIEPHKNTKYVITGVCTNVFAFLASHKCLQTKWNK